MTKTIALLSGKGGSGKTSLCLSIASFLSTCDIKILLVDCDFSTNGASYFFEDDINACEDVISLDNILQNKNLDNKVVKIKKNFDFIPSVAKISGKKFNSEILRNFDITSLKKIINNYDIVIYDCQAGYSEVLDKLLPEVDETLFVMEADAISSASIRALHLKIGELLNKKSYQVFNKVTREEYDIYNKVTGTFFTNIESVIFDWTIRKAFALCKIPNIENVSTSFMEQIINISSILFDDSIFVEKIGLLKKQLSQKKQKILTERINFLQYSKRRQTYKIALLIMCVILMGAFAMLSYTILDGKFFAFTDKFTSLSFLAAFLSVILSLVFLVFSKNSRIEELKSLQKQLLNYENKINEFGIEKN